MEFIKNISYIMGRKAWGVRSVLLLSALFMLFPQTRVVQAAQKPVSIQVYYAPLKYVFEGKLLAPPDGQRGFIYNNSTYVPLRFVAYSLGQAVIWDSSTYTVTVEPPGSEEKRLISEYISEREIVTPDAATVHSDLLLPTELDVYMEQVIYIFGGKQHAPSADLPGFIINNTLYVPLRFFSESAGHHIEWDQETYTVSAASERTQTVASGGLLDLIRGKKWTRGDAPLDVGSPDDNQAIGGGGQGGVPSGSFPGGGGGGIGGGDGTVPVKPSKEAIEAKYISRAEQLQDRCESNLTGLALQYIVSKADEVKKELKSRSESELSSCERDFAEIIQALTDELQSYQYSTEVADRMIKEFRRQKEFGESVLCRLIGCT